MKRVIPFALLLSVAGFAQAQSSYTIYGLVDASYGKSLLEDRTFDGTDFHLDGCDGSATAGKNKADFHSGGDNCNSNGNSTTRIGIKGSADVGSGVKVNFKFESNGITSDGDVNKPFFGRQAWVGFSGGFGEVRLGRQDSVSFQTTVDYDFNGASNGVSALTYTGVAPYLPGRQSRSLQYISPSFGGFKAQLGFQPKGNGGDTAKDVYSAAATFATGPVSVTVTGQTKGFTDTKNFASIAGSFDFGVAKISASYADGGKAIEGGSGKGYGLGVVVPVAGFNIGAIYGKNRDADTGKARAYELFVNKEIFKNTYAYAEFGDWKASNLTVSDGETTTTSDAKAKGYAVGVIFTF